MIVTYRVPENHHTKTVRGKKTLAGSVHHPEMVEFTGLVTRDWGDGSFDLTIFPPHKAPVHLDRVKPGDGAGQFRDMLPVPIRKADRRE